MTDLPDADSATANTIITTGLGFIGGAMSVLFGPRSLTPIQKIGCIVAGGTCAFVFAPLVPLVWPAAGPRVQSVAGFVFGIGGLFFVRGVLSWLTRAEQRIPDQIDNRLGVDTKPKSPPTPIPPAKTEEPTRGA